MGNFFSACKKSVRRGCTTPIQDFTIFVFQIGSSDRVQEFNRALTPQSRTLKDFSVAMYFPEEGSGERPRYMVNVSTYPSCYTEWGGDLKTHNFEWSQINCYKDSRLPYFTNSNLVILGVDDFEVARIILVQMMGVRSKYNKTTDVPVIIINLGDSLMPTDLPGNIIYCINDYPLPDEGKSPFYNNYQFIRALAADCFEKFLAHDEGANRTTPPAHI